MGVDDVKHDSKLSGEQAVLAEELLAGRDIGSIDWSKADKRGFTVLHCLLSVRATPEREEQILQLLSRTTNVFSLVHWHEDNTAPSSTTPLYLAIIGGYYRVWPYLLQKGANVNQPSLPFGLAADETDLPQYPFWVACNLKDSALTYTIIQNIMGMFEFGVQPFTCMNEDDWAVFCQLFGRKECSLLFPKLCQHIALETLLTKEIENKIFSAEGFGMEKAGWLSMLCAVRNSNIAGIDALLKKGLPLVWPEKHASFLDIYLSPKTAVVPVPEVILVENGCNPSEKPQFGDVNALMKVIHTKNIPCLRSMLQGGKKLSSFNIDVLNDKGQTPLFIACSKDTPCRSVIEVLLENGADPNIPSGQGYNADSPLSHCFFNNKLDLALLLLDAGATLDNRKFVQFLEYGIEHKDNDLLHTVIVACACAMRGIVESTVASLNKERSYPFDISNRSLRQYGTSFLHIACSHGSKSTVIYLLQQNHNLNEKNYRGNLPVHTALQACHEDIALFLLNNGADYYPNGDGIDSLSMACANDLPEAAVWLAKKGGKLRSIINVGFTSLLACEHVCTEYVRWAIENCRKSGATSFLDGEFPPTEASLWINRSSPPPNEAIEHPDHWKPVKRMCFQPSLFGKEQGNISDSYLMGTIAMLTTRPELLQDMFVMHGRWTFVVIDGMIPCNKFGKPCYASSKDSAQTYVMLLEKAYAKLRGSYEGLECGVGRHAMMEFTGGVCKQTKFVLDETSLKEAIQTRSLWKILQDHHRQGRLMTCEIEKPYGTAALQPNGLLANHSYGILNLAKVDKQHLIQLYNPHPKGDLTGNWNEASSAWAKFPALENTLLGKQGGAAAGLKDGIFCMCYEDFIQIFNTVDVTHVVYSPKTKHTVGFTQHKNVDISKGKAFAISSAHVPAQVTIEIRQHITDFLNRDSFAGEEVMLMVCTFDNDSYSISTDTGGAPKSITLHGDLRTARIVERVLPTADSKFALFFTMWHRHTPYFIVPLAMDKVNHLTCDVGIYTDKAVDHLAVNMLIPFWGGTEVDLDERKKQELLKVKGRKQIAKARARGVRTSISHHSTTYKSHCRNLSANATVNSSPLFFNAPSSSHGLPRSLFHSYSNPALAVRNQSQRNASTSPHLPASSPHSPHSPRSPLSPPSPSSPRSPRSPRTRRNASPSTNNNNNATNSTTNNTSNNTSNNHVNKNTTTTTATTTASNTESSKKNKYKDKLKQLKQLLKAKDDEITRLRDESRSHSSNTKKSPNTVSYFDFIPPPIKR